MKDDHCHRIKKEEVEVEQFYILVTAKGHQLINRVIFFLHAKQLKYNRIKKDRSGNSVPYFLVQPYEFHLCVPYLGRLSESLIIQHLLLSDACLSSS